MKYIKYFLQFLFISCLLILFMIVGLKFSRIIASKLFSIFGPFFRSKKIIEKNVSFAFHESDKEFQKIAKNENLKIITTEKDFMKIPKEFKKEINFLSIDLVIQDERKLIELLTK